MTILDDGIELNVKIEKPANAPEKLPLVIILHGYTGHMEEPHVQAMAQAVLEAGAAAMRVDLYGHGHSGGSFEKHNLYKWLNNALTVIDYARGLDFVTRLFLCGHSQGGMTAMLAAAMKRDVIDGLIALSPAWMIPEEARRGVLLGQRFDPESIPERLQNWDGSWIGGNYLRVAQTVHVEEAIDGYKKPVLIVHGEADETVPVSYAIEAASRYRDCKLVLIPEDTHCFDLHLDQAADAVKAWLMERRYL